MEKIKNLSISILLTAICFKSVNTIECYQCSGTDSNNPFECNEFLENDIDLNPTDCATIHNAQYCIKHVGRYEGDAIDCFQCNSSSTMECGDGLMTLDGGALVATSCDHVYDARFCIKQIANTLCLWFLLMYMAAVFIINPIVFLHNGGISTKRFCSSLDLGNYCNYVQQPGDKLEYRTCIYTCSSDGCNGAPILRISTAVIISIIFMFITV